jgi:hypothetical protein
MRKLGVGYYKNSAATDMQYGSSDGITVNNATTPDLLVEGSIGIYGDAKDGTGLALITSASTLSNYTSFVMYQGGKNELILLAQFYGSELTTIDSIAFSKPTKQVSYVGWNGSTGSLNNATTVAGDSGQIQLNQRAVTNNPIDSYFIIGDTGNLAASATGYNILLGAVKQLNIPRGSTQTKKGTLQITTNTSSVADFTGTATALKFTKGSTTVGFYIENATSGWTASTGTVADGDVINVPHQNMQVVTFTADALGSSAGRHLITIGGTIYNVADAGSAAQNATAIAAAINAGTQATATASSSTVVITLLPNLYSAKILVVKTADDSTWSAITLTLTTTTGETTSTIYKANGAVSSAASFELDYAYEGETMYVYGGTNATLNTGIVTLSGSPVYGAKFMAINYFEEFTHQVNGILENATLTYALTSYALKPTTGSGQGQDMRELENLGRYYRGAVDTYSAVAKTPTTLYTDLTGGYDQYSIVITPLRSDGTAFNATSSNQYEVDMAFVHPNLAVSTGDNQYEWEAILDLFVTAYPNLAYTSLV